MKARILEKSEEHLWDEWIMKHPLSTIHQCSTWGHFQEEVASRGKYWILVIEDNRDCQRDFLGGTMIIRHKLPYGFTWLYAARGPLFDYDSSKAQEYMDSITKTLESIAKKENSVFLRIDPPLPNYPIFQKFSQTKNGFQPEHTLILDITKSEEDLLKEMKPKGRYNIRLAQKKGVKIRIADPKNKAQFEKDVTAYHKILQETTQRDHFYGHRKGFYKKMLEILHNQKLANLYLAEYEGKIIAGIIITSFKDTATYYFGASGNQHRNVMAPYLLQWQAIQDAKKHELKYYDFLGIAPENDDKHAWKGVTSFKKKFGGKSMSYSPAQEYSFRPFFHFLYKIHKKIK